MQVVHYFYKFLAKTPLKTCYHIKLSAIVLQVFMMMVPIQRIIHKVNESGLYLRRSKLWVSCLSLLVLSNPMLFDMSCYHADYQGILFCGFVLWTIS